MKIVAGSQVTWREESQNGKIIITTFRDGIVKSIVYGIAIVQPSRGKVTQVPVSKLRLSERKTP